MDQIADIPMPNHEVIGPPLDDDAYDALWDIVHKAIAVLMTFPDGPATMPPAIRDLGNACCELIHVKDATEAQRATERRREIARIERAFGPQLWD